VPRRKFVVISGVPEASPPCRWAPVRWECEFPGWTFRPASPWNQSERMIILHDPDCAGYGSSLRPEQPARVVKTAAHLRNSHPDWEWRKPTGADESVLLLAHSPAHLKRLQEPRDFDDDTPFFDGIYGYAHRSVGAALAGVDLALQGGTKAFSLMRPPGHHATQAEAMGFCYLNQIAVAALAARERKGVRRVAVWDFDAHHGNGTEAILRGREGVVFSSVHQYPGYPGTGVHSEGNCHNFPVAPHTPRAIHLEVLRQSWDVVLAFEPDLVLVSAGFDAYARDPITAMTLETDDFAELGRWLGKAGIPAVPVLEGGYSPDLPLLVDSFLTAWA
jgi:acetoin utilization deacetylase AcuC-like enzyme